MSSSHWKIIVTHLQNIINKQKHNLRICLQHSDYCSNLYRLSIRRLVPMDEKDLNLPIKYFSYRWHSAQVLYHMINDGDHKERFSIHQCWTALFREIVRERICSSQSGICKRMKQDARSQKDVSWNLKKLQSSWNCSSITNRCNIEVLRPFLLH